MKHMFFFPKRVPQNPVVYHGLPWYTPFLNKLYSERNRSWKRQSETEVTEVTQHISAFRSFKS